MPAAGVSCSAASANAKRLCRCKLVTLAVDEKAALVDLYTSTRGSYWYYGYGWQFPGGDPVQIF